MANLHLGDDGVVLVITVKEDGSAVNLSAATSLQIRLRKPDGTTVAEAATLTTDGSNGQLQCSIDGDEVDVLGVWEARPHFTLGAWTGHGSAVKFTVLRV
jgi:hypothetical protein